MVSFNDLFLSVSFPSSLAHSTYLETLTRRHLKHTIGRTIGDEEMRRRRDEDGLFVQPSSSPSNKNPHRTGVHLLESGFKAFVWFVVCRVNENLEKEAQCLFSDASPRSRNRKDSTIE